jgi:YD repeat-containing protein
LDFTDAYTGDLHLYALDWDSSDRRQTITVNDGTTSTVIDLTSSFNDGAWTHYPITVTAGGTITITIDRTAGGNAVLSGLFLGNNGSSSPEPEPDPDPEPEPPPPAPEMQGDWVGVVGADGYGLAAWDDTTDLVSLPNATLTVEQGNRYRWVASTTDIRALEAPDQSQRRAATYYHSTQIRLRLDFTDAYTGDLHLYALDWDSSDRRQTITVNDGTTSTVIDLTSSFNDGAWTHYPITVTAGGTITITIDRTAGGNAVLSGLFLGNNGS